MDYEDRILKCLTSRNLDDNLWGATFAAGAEESIDKLVRALVDLLQRDERDPLGKIGDINYELCVGRAATSLVCLFTKLAPLRVAEYCAARTILTRLTLSDSFQISAHAIEALDRLEREVKVDPAEPEAEK